MLELDGYTYTCEKDNSTRRRVNSISTHTTAIAATFLHSRTPSNKIGDVGMALDARTCLADR